MPSVSTTTTSAAPASTAATYACFANSRSARLASTPKNATRIPCVDGERDRRADPLEHRLPRDPERGQLPVRDRALDHRGAQPELEEGRDVRADGAREAPDLGVEACLEDERDRAGVVLGHAREAGLDAVDARGVERACDLQLVLGREHDADRLLAVAQGRVVEADRGARLRLERLRVQVSRPELRAVERHAWTIPSGKRRELLGSFGGDEEVVLDAEAAAALDIASWLDCKHHALADLAASGLVRVRRLVGASADAVRDRVRGLAGEAHGVDARADAAVELGEARSGAGERDRVLVDGQELLLELAVLLRELARDEVLRVVAPVAVGADPDLEERRLALDDGPARRRREGLDPGPGPDEREAERELDLPLPARALAVDEPLPLGGDLRLGHAGLDDELAVLHRGGGDLVREAHPLDLLRGLERSGFGKERGRVLGVVAEGVEPVAGEGRRLADHAVGGLRPERELEPDGAVVCGCASCARSSDAGGRRPRIAGVVACEEPHVLVHAVRRASSSLASRQISVGSPSRGKTQAS